MKEDIRDLTIVYRHNRLPICLHYYPLSKEVKYWYNILTAGDQPTIPELNVCYPEATLPQPNAKGDIERDPNDISDDEFSLYILKYAKI